MSVSSLGRRPLGFVRRLSRRLVVAGLIAIFLWAGTLSVGTHPSSAVRSFSSGQPGGGGGIVVNRTLNLTDAPSFDPSSVTAAPGNVVAFRFHNTGALNHTFTLSKDQNFTVNHSWTPTELNAYFRANGSWVNITVAPGATVGVNVSIPATALGSYEFVSTIPYQFQAGMFGFLNLSAGGASSVHLSVQTAGSGFMFLPSNLDASNTTAFPVVVSVAVSNLGSVPHTFTVDATPNSNLTPTGFNAYFQTHPPLTNVPVPTSPGTVAWANFTVTQRGVYQFICTISGHFAAGMFGYLYVGVPVPAVAAPLSSDLVQPVLLLGGGVLLAVGISLAVVAAVVVRVPKSGPR